ncbi:MAG: CD0519/CD1768 family membrane protein [Erysipelotrichaceae bacterium]
MHNEARIKKAISLESFVFLGIFLGFFFLVGSEMGTINMLNTLMNTSYALLLDTVFLIMSIAVVAGAVAGLFTEFGVVSLLNHLLSPLIKPIFGLPGASIMGIFATYMSDNPAILTLAADHNFKRYFKKYQLPALTNIGTGFGMGLIITTFMISLSSPTGESYVMAALIGNLGAVMGSIVSVRLMLFYSKKQYGTTALPEDLGEEEDGKILENFRVIREGSISSRAMESMLEGGKSGVSMGLAIIPGVLIICTLVMLLTNGPSASGVYTGAAYEGIGLFPWLGEKLSFILTPLFGFTSPNAIAVPLTSLGAAGAAIGLIPNMIAENLVRANDIAVFTAMCMCFSGYLSTHVAMMDSLKFSHLTGKAIFSHTIGGIVAGVSANLLFQFFTLFL